jgi:hypothetical protein
MTTLNTAHGGFQALRRFMRKQPSIHPVAEQCELCAAPLATKHHHLADLSRQTLVCTCDACAILFADGGAGHDRYQLVPRHYLVLPDFRMTDELWDELMIPVNMVYIFRSALARHVIAFYPSPGGAMQSLLSLENWSTLLTDNPILNELKPDVEALLINRIRDQREYYIVPIDTCYQLVGLIRSRWKGLSGGDAVWQAIEAFFADLRIQSQIMRGEVNARPEL